MGTCSQTSAHRVRIAMNGQEYNPRFTCRCFQLISSLNTVQIRHGDVCDDNIGRNFIVCSNTDRPLATFPTTSNSEGRRCSTGCGKRGWSSARRSFTLFNSHSQQVRAWRYPSTSLVAYSEVAARLLTVLPVRRTRGKRRAQNSQTNRHSMRGLGEPHV